MRGEMRAGRVDCVEVLRVGSIRTAVAAGVHLVRCEGKLQIAPRVGNLSDCLLDDSLLLGSVHNLRAGVSVHMQLESQKIPQREIGIHSEHLACCLHT